MYVSGKGRIIELTTSNSVQDKKAGTMSVSEDLPLAKMVNAMCPTKEAESAVAWERKCSERRGPSPVVYDFFPIDGSTG